MIVDQKSQVTLEKASDIAPEELDCYIFTNNLLMHHKYLSDEHNGTRYLDRIIAPESHRKEILQVGHTIPLSCHMGGKKTFKCIAVHFFLAWSKF